MKRKPLSELYVDGKFTQDRERQKELQRHCEGVFSDPDETREVQEGRIEYFKMEGDQHFTDEGEGQRLRLTWCQARAKRSENKVNGPEDAVVSEMIKQLLKEKNTSSRSVFTNASWV